LRHAAACGKKLLPLIVLLAEKRRAVPFQIG